MARKPNYDFERKERERQKAAKKAERAAAKEAAKAGPSDGAGRPDAESTPPLRPATPE
ncbi:MAG: hypothetical protein COW30_13255 [Rhodospirillales bacterium CG15_BIG_FIL_POST_REV_8_21_14_020_66_15]|nr:MAG: hypothetical protein COW30_13255 [Rhodospirillales bacterium CG15_BIG_FIL_POST_REV_8_21_14_020_66_15]